MRVLVTGGAGFIGSHVAAVLLAQDHDVTVLDNLSAGYRRLCPDGARFIEGDLADEERLPGWLRGHDAVIHMAGFIEVERSVREPLAFTINNVVNSVRLLEGMRQADVGKIVFSSSACVYGVPSRLPIREDDPLGVQSNPYGASKVSIESFVATYNQVHGMDAVILRYFNPYGPNELHRPETHAIPNFVRAALARRPMPLYWKGETVRDYIYVEDLARAHVEVLALSGLHYFNVGTETGTRNIDVVRTLFEGLGYEVAIDDLGPRAGDVMANYASSGRLRAATGWQAQVDVREGLARTVEWFRSGAGE